MDYDDWGNVLTNTSPDFTPFGFAGGMYDSQTGLVRFATRDYDSSVGRWLCKDLIGFKGSSHNLFTYLSNDPLNYIDPEGKAELCFRRFDFKGWTLAYYAALYPLGSIATGHCYISYSKDAASSYGTWDLANKDPLSETYFKLCTPITGGECCSDECLKKAMEGYAAPQGSYDWLDKNCCDAARNAINQCGCKMPLLGKIANFGR